jgi:hypothetical protein
MQPEYTCAVLDRLALSNWSLASTPADNTGSIADTTALGSSLAFEQLPNDVQAHICSLVATPSSPAHVLLGVASKTWGAAAAQHFKPNAASITLELSCSSSSAKDQRLREGQRLASLSAWLRRYGPSLHKLEVQVPQFGLLMDEYMVGRAQGLCGILGALAAAGKRPGGLQLKQLHLPLVPGGARPVTVHAALRGCHQLRDLQLTYCCGSQEIRTYKDFLGGPFPVGRQHSQLTSLRVTVTGAVPHQDMPSCERLDDFCTALPSSLEDLAVDFGALLVPYHRRYTISASSLRHLVALQRLKLPDSTYVTSSSPYESLDTLTALTSLVFEKALLGGNLALLAAPNLQGIWTHYAQPSGLEALAPLTALRTLACAVRLDDGGDGPAALLQLTQLTRLGLLVMEGAEQEAAADMAVDADDWEDDDPATIIAMWGGAVSALPGLRSLTVEPGMLPLVDLAPLTALTELVVRADWHKQAYPPGRLHQLLGGVGAGRGRLQVVKVQGALRTQQAPCRAALAATLGGVTVTFV